MSETNTSKRLSYLLRHRKGFTNSGGWASVDDVCRELKIRPSHLMNIVDTDDKGRYEIDDDFNNVRAVQGHSHEVDLGLKPVAPPDILYHGTTVEASFSIAKEGLKPGERQYVHLSHEVDTARSVALRRNKGIVIYSVNAGKMYDDASVNFYRSKNGVWLVDSVPTEYLEALDMEED